MRKLILICIISPWVSFGQSYPDSLWRVWNDKSAADSSRLNALDLYTWQKFIFSNPDSALYYAQVHYDFAKEVGATNQMAKSLNNKGVALLNQSKYDPAIETFQKALKLFQQVGDKQGIGNAYNNIGLIYIDKGEYPAALEQFRLSLKWRKEENKKSGVADSYNNMGTAYYYLGNMSKAIECYGQSLKVKEEINDKLGVATSLNNIGILYKVQENYEEAKTYFNKSLEAYKKLNHQKGIGAALTNLGSVYDLQGDTKKQQAYLEEALEIYQKMGSQDGVATTLGSLGLILLEENKLKEAFEYLQQSLLINEELSNKLGITSSNLELSKAYEVTGDLKKSVVYGKKSLAVAKEMQSPMNINAAAQQLYTCYKKLGDYGNALAMYELYVTTGDSIKNENNQKEVIRQQYKYTYEKQAAADSVKAAEAAKLKDAQLAAQKAENVKQKQQAYFLYGGLALALLFGGFIFNRFRVTNKQKAIIEEQKTEVEAQRELAEKQRSEAESQKLIVEAKNHEILDSIQYAKRLQEAILPPQKIVKEYLNESFILYKPKDIVAGDFYWMETPPPKSPSPKGEGDNSSAEKILPDGEDLGGAIYFAAADCTGHGVPGAMVSVVCSNALSKALMEDKITDPGKILDRTRELVIEHFGKGDEEIKDGMDIALVKLGLHDGGGQSLHYAGANNPLWIVRKGTSEVEEVKADKQPIGKYAAEKPFTTHEVKLHKGDSIYIFSDGYVDQFGGDKGKKYKSGQLKKLLLSIAHEPMHQQLEILNTRFETWKKDLEQTDDVCVIGVRV